MHNKNTIQGLGLGLRLWLRLGLCLKLELWLSSGLGLRLVLGVWLE